MRTLFRRKGWPDWTENLSEQVPGSVRSQTWLSDSLLQVTTCEANGSVIGTFVVSVEREWDEEDEE